MVFEYKGPRLPKLKFSYDGSNTAQYETEMFPEARNQKDSIKSSIQNIIKTRIGERVMSNFGSNIDFTAFEKCDNDLALLGSNMIRDAIATYEPRVTIENISYKFEGDEIIWNIVLREISNYEDTINISIKNK